MAVSFVGIGSTYTASGLGTSFTLNKPDDAAAGDRLYALVACWANGSQKTISATGWTMLNTAYRDVGVDEIQLFLLHRYVEEGDPASWSATVSGNVALRSARVVAYRGVQQTGNRGTATAAAGSSFATATVNNTAANSWRVTFGAAFSANATYNLSVNSDVSRGSGSVSSGDALQFGIWDSNAGIATGNTSRTLSRSSSWKCAASIIFLLQPSPGTPASGDMAGRIGAAVADGDGLVVNEAELQPTLGAVAFDADGFGQPPVVEGALSPSLGAAEASGEGGVPVTAEMGASIGPVASFVGETRHFGVRTIIVEADDRTIEVESRAVAD